MKYLITGATGDVGSRVVRRLVERQVRPGVLVRNVKKARSLFSEHVDIYEGDLAEASSMRQAFQAAEIVFLVNVGPAIPERDGAVSLLARETGVRRIVKLSS